MNGKDKVVLAGFAAALMLYIGSYASLSSRGQYVPGSWGLSWVKSYEWGPRGVAYGPAGMERNRLLQIFYLPLWIIDIRFVHTSKQMDSGRYPINTRLDEELQRSTLEWNKKQEAERSKQNTQGEVNGSPPAGANR